MIYGEIDLKMSTHKSSAVQQDSEEVRLERMFEEDYLRSYAYKAAALSKEDAVSEQPLEEWKFYKNPIMTAKGKRIVCDDPNISSDTLEKLIVSEHEYLSCKENSWLLSKSKQEIYDEVFLSMREVGLAHMSQCITDNINQCKAELITRYCDDKRLPFIVGALYLDAYMASEHLFYYRRSMHQGYIREPWSPKLIYLSPRTMMPPQKKKDFKKYYEAFHEYAFEIPDCPLCGSSAKMYRTGMQNRFWHVCCTDSNARCPNYFGLSPREDDRDAADDWINYCRTQNAAV
jgi:hypothetical protein